MTTEAPEDEGTVAQYRGVIAIEWPQQVGKGPHGAMTGWHATIIDTATGKPILTCMRADVHIELDALVTADLTLFADEDGEPLLDALPVLDGEIQTGVFPFLVSEMRLRST